MAGEVFVRRWATWHDDPVQDTPADAQFYQKAEDALVRLLGNADPLDKGVEVWDAALGKFKTIKLTTANLDPAAGILGTQIASGQSGSPGNQVLYDEFATNKTTTATTAATSTIIVASNGDVGFNFDGTAVIIEFFCPKVYHSVANTAVFFELIDSASGLGLIAAGRSASTTDGDSVYGVRKLTPSAGSHNFKIGAWVAAAGTGTAAAAGGGAFGTLVPGFLRITKA